MDHTGSSVELESDTVPPPPPPVVATDADEDDEETTAREKVLSISKLSLQIKVMSVTFPLLRVSF